MADIEEYQVRDDVSSQGGEVRTETLYVAEKPAGGIAPPPPPVVETKAFAKGFPSSATEDDVKRYFSRFGEVLELFVRPAHNSDVKYCFVTFETHEQLDAALAFDRHEYEGNPITVTKREPKVCYECQQEGHLSSRCPLRRRNRDRDPRDPRDPRDHRDYRDRDRRRPYGDMAAAGGAGKACYACGKEGHLSRYCPSKTDGGYRRRRDSRERDDSRDRRRRRDSRDRDDSRDRRRRRDSRDRDDSRDRRRRRDSRGRRDSRERRESRERRRE